MNERHKSIIRNHATASIDLAVAMFEQIISEAAPDAEHVPVYRSMLSAWRAEAALRRQLSVAAD